MSVVAPLATENTPAPLLPVRNPMLRAEIEDLLYHEAELLDTWKLKEWLALFTEDGTYYVPSTDLSRDASSDTSLFYIADDPVRLRERVVRLMKKTAHAEWPRSRTRHLVSNVRVLAEGDGEIKAAAAFATWRMKHGNTDVYIGSSHYRLRRIDGGLRIVEKRIFLDLESLRPHGRVSILL
ncbi:aromatic-ring-hydroxylating dioxygenase subunit beta [Stenotrophomonas tumulicola]|uniref:Aromatic-ring-hydroxylating dioxygenase subunit beta n=1 Tax=Stenotrophomonas tumulicola TaxID=1685415 RepID=A0A7W3IIA9_9GAMM|nr:aromatic-ring-hydroxylating dioxygenase subunit beta [Stenotrophomonas tumulicola]MBA8682732.1 aromatic-ring-hydroxylating dioxygenase subunit beta [Stenotrophomonas tumulicola]